MGRMAGLVGGCRDAGQAVCAAGCGLGCVDRMSNRLVGGTLHR